MGMADCRVSTVSEPAEASAATAGTLDIRISPRGGQF